MEQPTKGQLEYAKILLRELGYDVDDYPLSEMSKQEVSELIDDLKDELRGHEVLRAFGLRDESSV